MGTLKQTLQQLLAAKKAVEISWLWDGGVDVKAGDEDCPGIDELLIF